MSRSAAIDRYRAAPSLSDAENGRSIREGHRGAEVRQIQELINAAAGATVVEVDGYFGPATERALRALQERLGLRGDGKVGPNTLAALRSAAAVVGSADLSAVDLSTTDRRGSTPARTSRRRTAPTDAPASPSAPRPAAPTTTVSGAGAAGASAAVTPTTECLTAAEADRRLAELQAAALACAEGELAARVREDRRTPNRGARVDEYARAAGHPVGLEWCGNFVAFNFREAGMHSGSRGVTQLSNSIRATYFFNYRQFTDTSRDRAVAMDALRGEHEAQGSVRQFWTLPDSLGERYLRDRARTFGPELDLDAAVRPSTELPLRAGDIVMFQHPVGDVVYYHIGIVRSYDPTTGHLETVEGNINGGQVGERSYDVNSERFRERLYGFGRPALADFTAP